MILLLTLTAHTSTRKATAQLWRPEIERYVAEKIFSYNGNMSPKIGKWPGNLFQNYSYITVSVVVYDNETYINISQA